MSIVFKEGKWVAVPEKNEVFTHIINGKPYTPSPDDIFIVQSNKGKSAYRTHFLGTLTQALSYYYCINIGKDYNKRVIVISPEDIKETGKRKHYRRLL